MVKVDSIVDPDFKSGMGKKGQWRLVKVKVGDKVATGFAPIQVGDEVDLEYNDEYKNWNFKKLGPQDIPDKLPNDTQKLLELIYDDTQAILKFVSPLIEKPKVDEVADVPEGDINLNDIPF